MFKSALSIFLVSCLLGLLVCTDHKLVTVKRGESATLECYGSPGAAVLMLQWRKPELQSEQENTNKQLYVLFIRDNRNYENHQLPSFKGRVQLRDPQMKDGDLSVIIKDVSMNDAGVYECYAGYDTQEPQLMISTNLKVEEPGEPGGQREDGANEGEEKEDKGKKDGSAGLILAAVLSAALVGLVYFYKCRNTRRRYQRVSQRVTA